MLIGKKWKIESDDLNVVLFAKKTRRNKVTGEAYVDWESVGYFATLPQALTELVNQGVRDTGLQDLELVLSELKKLGLQIERCFKNATALPRGVKT